MNEIQNREYKMKRNNVIIVKHIAYLLCTMLSLLEFGHLTYDREKLLNFLIKHKVLSDTIKYDKCGNDVKINKETLIYRCGKQYYIKNVHKKMFKNILQLLEEHKDWYLVPEKSS